MEKIRGRFSPAGSAVSGVIRESERTNEAYRIARGRYRRAEAVARLLIQFRMRHQLSQDQLAGLLGTSASAVSRLESGTHVPSLTTLSRIAEAVGEQLVIGFQVDRSKDPQSKLTLVAL